MEGGEILGKLMITCRIQRRNINWWLERDNSPNSEESKAQLGILSPPCKAPSFLTQHLEAMALVRGFPAFVFQGGCSPPACRSGRSCGNAVPSLGTVFCCSPGSQALNQGLPPLLFSPFYLHLPFSTQALPGTSKAGSLILDRKGQSCLRSTFGSHLSVMAWRQLRKANLLPVGLTSAHRAIPLC